MVAQMLLGESFSFPGFNINRVCFATRCWNGLLEQTNQRFEGIFKEIKIIINHVLSSVWWMDSSLSKIWSVKRSGELDCFYTLFKVDGRITSYA